MLFPLPPAIPVVEPVTTVVMPTARIKDDCAKGSRDCFPEDRVGEISEAIALSSVVYPARLPWLG